MNIGGVGGVAGARAAGFVCDEATWLSGDPTDILTEAVVAERMRRWGGEGGRGGEAGHLLRRRVAEHASCRKYGHLLLTGREIRRCVLAAAATLACRVPSLSRFHVLAGAGGVGAGGSGVTGGGLPVSSAVLAWLHKWGEWCAMDDGYGGLLPTIYDMAIQQWRNLFRRIVTPLSRESYGVADHLPRLLGGCRTVGDMGDCLQRLNELSLCCETECIRNRLEMRRHLQAALGNPFRPVRYKADGGADGGVAGDGAADGGDVRRAAWLARRMTPDAARLTAELYERPDPATAGVLSDALEEAGCDDEAVLMPLRGCLPLAVGGFKASVASAIGVACGHGVRWYPAAFPPFRGMYVLDLLREASMPGKSLRTAAYVEQCRRDHANEGVDGGAP